MMIRRLWKYLKLTFDRSFSGASWKQITWLFCILAMVLGFSLWIKSRYSLDLHDMRILELLLDPGSFVLQEGDPLGYERLPLLALTFLGAIFFTGGLISVVSNILTGRIARFRQGEIRYRFDGHIVLLGANDTAAGLIRELHAEPENGRRDIVLLTQSDAEALRRKLHTQLSPAEERRLIILHGQRDSREELEKIHIQRADRVYLLSDDGELEHDSVSINALVQISSLLGSTRRRKPLPCYLSFEYQSSFRVFQLADFEEAERMKSRIHFSATNFHENWAQRVLVSGCCNCNGKDILYLPLDRDGIGAESDRYVHLIVVGMSRMGVAMGVTAAHIAHYPNFITRGIRTRITFIDPDAGREMDFLKGRYEPLFQLSHHTLRKSDATGGETLSIHTPQEDFLDVEWEFVEGGIESPYVRKLLKDWTADEKAIPTLAICGNSAPENVAAALYLPQQIYDRQIPIFVYQKETATILEIARRSALYRTVYPFGMMCESYDATLKQRIRKAKRINYIYEHFFAAKSAAEKQAQERGEKFDFNTFAAGFEIPEWSDDAIDRCWNDLSLAFQWSNIYAANAIPSKFRAMEIAPEELYKLNVTAQPLPEEERIRLKAVEELFTRVEHNRWNIERLLMGYRPATAAERERAYADEQYNKILKNKLFIHINIAPYEEIPDETKAIDRILTRFLYRVEQ